MIRYLFIHLVLKLEQGKGCELKQREHCSALCSVLVFATFIKIEQNEDKRQSMPPTHPSAERMEDRGISTIG